MIRHLAFFLAILSISAVFAMDRGATRQPVHSDLDTLTLADLHSLPPEYVKLLFNFTVTQKNVGFVQIQKWFTKQRVDHYNVTDERTFQQRYWIVDEYFDRKSGPVLLLICGEYTCPGVMPTRQFSIMLAQKFNALILVLEHRYYGASHPFKELTTANMRWLTSQQALEDLAYFTNFIKNSPEMHVTDANKWITIGGSYPGALSAWYRYKFPHLTVGALASSAVINAITDFDAFDDQIWISLQKSGDFCSKLLQDITDQVDTLLYNDFEQNKRIKNIYNAINLTNEEFLFFLAEIVVETVQYGGRVKLCDAIKKSEKDLYTILDLLKVFAAEFHVGAEDLGSYYLKNTTVDVNKNGRAWMYQVCSQVGWFNVPSKVKGHAMRSSRVNLDFYKKWCETIYGPIEGVTIFPDDSYTNYQLGGLNMKTDNVIFTNGDEDPWKHASLLHDSNGGKMEAIEINCTNCAHCVELYTPDINDSFQLHLARWKIILDFAGWLGVF